MRKTKRVFGFDEEYDVVDIKQISHRKLLLSQDWNGLCSICRLHRGCNSRWRRSSRKNWKNYRNTQYKGV